jgi:hypothetical protein
LVVFVKASQWNKSFLPEPLTRQPAITIQLSKTQGWPLRQPLNGSPGGLSYSPVFIFPLASVPAT